MNARDYKIFRPGLYYHIYNRGDNKENIFLDDQDYSNFLKRLKIVMGIMPVPNAGQRGALKIRPLPKDSFTILAYCLMPNHFHFLIKQNAELPVSDLMKKVGTSYAKYFNKKYERIGNIFQDIFKAKLVDSDAYLTYLSAYIHNNPLDPIAHPYSSFQEYLSSIPGPICNTEVVLNYFQQNRTGYKDFVAGFNEDQYLKIKDLVFEE